MSTGLPGSLKHIRKFQEPLRFGEDGKFRILHLTDIHEIAPAMEEIDDGPVKPSERTLETYNVIEKCLEAAKPDLVVFGGDNLSGFWDEFTYDYMVSTIRNIIEPVVRRNIPLAVVFGNHDSEVEEIRPFMCREIQTAFYAQYDNFRGSMNDEEVTGCGNYALPILSSDKSRIAWNIWCMDSGDYVRDEHHRRVKGAGYARIADDQIEWYERRAAELKAQNGGKPVPSILFQHIPVREEYELLEKVPEGAPNAVGKRDDCYAPKKGAFAEGVMRELPSPGQEPSGQFESWKRTGDMVAAFFGHDHVNTFVGEVDGIKLIQTVGAGYHSYGEERGGRLIILDENVTDDLYTETITVERVIHM